MKPAKHPSDNPIPPCSSRVPNKEHLAHSHPSRQLQRTFTCFQQRILLSNDPLPRRPPAIPSRYHPMIIQEHSRKGNSNLERSYYLSTQWHCRQLPPPPLVFSTSPNGNSTYSDNQTAIPRYRHMHTFTATMTTTLTHLFLSEWRHWSMTKPHRRKSFAQHCRRFCFRHLNRTLSLLAVTVFFKHKYITNPTVTPADAIIAATANLAHVLMSNTTAAHLSTTQLADLTRLHKIIQPTSTAKSTVSPTVNTTQPTAPKQNTAHPIVSDSDSETSLQSSKSTPPRPLYTPGQPIARSPRVTTTPPHMNNTASPRVTPHTAPAYNTCSRKQTITQETMLHLSQLPAPTFTAQRAASRLFPTEFLNAILAKTQDPKYSTIWKKAYGKELGRLAQGIPGIVQGTNTIVFIAQDDVPPDRRRDVTYGRICANFRPEKDDPHRVRLTVGGNRIHFPGDCGTPTADMLTTKILLNSIISTQGARFMTIDIKDFYLNTPMARPEFMRLKLADIPEEFIILYNRQLATRTDTSTSVCKKADIIAQQLLETRLVVNGYRQSTVTPGFWKHDWRPIAFALCVDDFGVKYVGIEHAKHLLHALNTHYTTSHDWKGD
eukprot:CCRYP_017301-RA/>CCRYP_017301-RA protein AED:0.20 eAED:0.20 QI:0/0/0/1/0.2/0.16/6/0/602